MTYELPEWSKQDDLDKIVPSEVRKALQAAHAAGRDSMTAENTALKADLAQRTGSLMLVTAENAALSAWMERAFVVHPDIDVDIAAIKGEKL